MPLAGLQQSRAREQALPQASGQKGVVGLTEAS